MSSLLATGCGGVGKVPPSSPAETSAKTGRVHGGQQPVVGARVYLYAVGASSGSNAISLLRGAGFVLSDVNGNFSITNDYPCPSGDSVYLLALGGSPGLGQPLNAEIALAAGLGSCGSFSASSFFTINEVTTVAFAYSLSSDASSETQIGAASGLDSAFANIVNLIDPVHGVALPTDSAYVRPQYKIDSLANSLAACVNSNGLGTPCSTLMSDANVSGSGSTPVDTFQAVLNISQNPTMNVAAIYNLAAASGVFEPALDAAPTDWTVMVTPNMQAPTGPNLPVPPAPTYTPPAFTPPSTPPESRRRAFPEGPSNVPAFFNGSVGMPNSQYQYLNFPDGNYFGYYYMPDASELYHVDLGYEYLYDANDGNGGLYLYDYTSTHFWYTSPSLFPYIYDFGLSTYLYYYPNASSAGRYNTDGVRYFYDFATGEIIVE